MKTKKLWAMIVSSIMILSLGLTGCGGSGQTGSGESTDQLAAVEDGTVPEDMTTPAAETTEGLNSSMNSLGNPVQIVDCSFTLEGKTYTLPIDYDTLIADGWTTNADPDSEVQGNTAVITSWTKEGKDNKSIYMYPYNGSGNTKKLRECQIATIEIHKMDLDQYSFALGNGLKPGDDQDTVTAAMGTPANTSDQSNAFVAQYGESEDTGQITFTWFKEAEDQEEGQDSIKIVCYQKEATATSNEVPEYLSQYQAPAALGADFDSATFTLDGTVYQLPCPVSEFEKDGWTLENNSDVMAGRFEVTNLKKNDMKVEIIATNYADYQTTVSNCVVKEIDINGYLDSVPDVSVPRGISMATSGDQLESAITGSSVEFQKDDTHDDYISYSYSDYEKGTGAYFNFDLEKNKITSIQISGDQWPGME